MAPQLVEVGRDFAAWLEQVPGYDFAVDYFPVFVGVVCMTALAAREPVGFDLFQDCFAIVVLGQAGDLVENEGMPVAEQ